MLKLTLCVLVFSCVIIAVYGFDGKTFNMFANLKSSIQWASKLLGLDKASDVANLVSSAFGKTQKKMDDSTNKDKPNSGNIFSGFLRIFGFDGKKVGAIAVNAIIFVAQLISSSLSLKKPSELTRARKVQEGTPYDWMLNNKNVLGLIDYIKDNQLPNYVVTRIKEHSMDEETDCIQLLICKTAPFVWGMQKALERNVSKEFRKQDTMYSFLPTLEEVSKHGDQCEKKHPYCFIHR